MDTMLVKHVSVDHGPSLFFTILKYSADVATVPESSQRVAEYVERGDLYYKPHNASVKCTLYSNITLDFIAWLNFFVYFPLKKVSFLILVRLY